MKARPINSAIDPNSSFLSEVAPFFINKTVSYADLGAGDGAAFLALLDWGLSVERAVLIEADRRLFVRLQENVASRGHGDRYTCANLALSDQGPSAGKRDPQDTRSQGANTTSSSLGEEAAAGTTLPFKDLGQFFPDRHLSILKIGVEWHEDGALRHCDAMLAVSAVDVLCVEVDVRADNPQDIFSRDIDSFVTSHGYCLFRVHEVAAEPIKELPGLRRLDLVFFSQTIAARFPMVVTDELSKLRRQLVAFERTALDLTTQRDTARADSEKLAKALNERFEEIAQLTRSFEVLLEERDLARAMLQSKTVAPKIKPVGDRRRRGYRMLIGGAVVYLLGVALLIAWLARTS